MTTHLLEAQNPTRVTILKSLRISLSIIGSTVEKNFSGQMTIRAGASKSFSGQMDILPYQLQKNLTLRFSIARTLFPSKTFKRSMLTGRMTIYKTQRLDHTNFRFDILERTPVFMSRRWLFNIQASDADYTAKSYETMILLDGEDVTTKIASVTINYGIEKFCGEVSIVWADWNMYEKVSVSNMKKNYAQERIEVKTRETGGDWTSLGKFFLEKRDINETYQNIRPTSWGRSLTSKLSDPYATPLNQSWSSAADGAGYVMAQEVCRGICTDHGITLSWEIDDFQILDSNLTAVDELPIRVIERLVKAVGGVLTTDKAGRLRAIWRYGD